MICIKYICMTAVCPSNLIYVSKPKTTTYLSLSVRFSVFKLVKGFMDIDDCFEITDSSRLEQSFDIDMICMLAVAIFPFNYVAC